MSLEPIDPEQVLELYPADRENAVTRDHAVFPPVTAEPLSSAVQWNTDDSGDRDFIGNVDQLSCRNPVTIPSIKH
jgi:hypothetical protein